MRLIIVRQFRVENGDPADLYEDFPLLCGEYDPLRILAAPETPSWHSANAIHRALESQLHGVELHSCPFLRANATDPASEPVRLAARHISTLFTQGIGTVLVITQIGHAARLAQAYFASSGILKPPRNARFALEPGSCFYIDANKIEAYKKGDKKPERCFPSICTPSAHAVFCAD